MLMMNRRALTLVSALSLATLSACHSVGDGNALQKLVIVPAEKVTASTLEADIAGGVAQTNAYQCITKPLDLFGLFNRANTFGQFESRAKWTSSDTDIATVSNGDIPYPGIAGTFLIGGTVVPGTKTGPVTITATYLDLSASIVVNVKAPVNLQLEPANPRLAVNSRQTFRVTAVLDGLKKDISVATAADNAVLSPASPTIAAVVTASDGSTTVSGTTTVNALAAGGPLSLGVNLPFCNQSLATNVTVADIQTLSIQHEPGFSGDLIVNTNELLRPMADFGSGPEQDLTGQAVLAVDSSTDTDAANRVVLGGTVAQAAKSGAAVAITATCCTLDRNANGNVTDAGEAATATSAPLMLTPVDATLTSFTISPADATVAQYNNQQFVANGVFDNGARTQTITRLVTWSSSNELLLSLLAQDGVFSSSAGLGVVLGDVLTAPSTVTVTAALLSSVKPSTATTPLTTTLTITPYVAP